MSSTFDAYVEERNFQKDASNEFDQERAFPGSRQNSITFGPPALILLNRIQQHTDEGDEESNIQNVKRLLLQQDLENKLFDNIVHEFNTLHKQMKVDSNLSELECDIFAPLIYHTSLNLLLNKQGGVCRKLINSLSDACYLEETCSETLTFINQIISNYSNNNVSDASSITIPRDRDSQTPQGPTLTSFTLSREEYIQSSAGMNRVELSKIEVLEALQKYVTSRVDDVSTLNADDVRQGQGHEETPQGQRVLFEYEINVYPILILLHIISQKIDFVFSKSMIDGDDNSEVGCELDTSNENNSGVDFKSLETFEMKAVKSEAPLSFDLPPIDTTLSSIIKELNDESTSQTRMNEKVSFSFPDFKNIVFEHENPVCALAFSPSMYTTKTSNNRTTSSICCISPRSSEIHVWSNENSFSPFMSQIQQSTCMSTTTAVLSSFIPPNDVLSLERINDPHSNHPHFHDLTYVREDKVLSGSSDGSLHLFHIHNDESDIPPTSYWGKDRRERHLFTYTGHNGPVWCVEVDPTRDLVVTGSMDTTARLWDIENETSPVRIYAGHEDDVDCIAFHPNSSYLVTGSSDHTVRMWDHAQADMVRLFIGHSSPVSALAISPDGQSLASSDKSGTLIIWDISTGKSRFISRCSDTTSSSTRCVVWSHNSETVFSGTSSGRIVCVQDRENRRLHIQSECSTVLDMVTTDNNVLLIGGIKEPVSS